MECVVQAGNRAVVHQAGTFMRCRTGTHKTRPVQHDFMVPAIAANCSLTQPTSWHTGRSGPPPHVWRPPGRADNRCKSSDESTFPGKMPMGPRHDAVVTGAFPMHRGAWSAGAALAMGAQQRLLMVPVVASQVPVLPAVPPGRCASRATTGEQPGYHHDHRYPAGFPVLLTPPRFQSTNAGLHRKRRLGTAKQTPLWSGRASLDAPPMRRSCATAHNTGSVAAC